MAFKYAWLALVAINVAVFGLQQFIDTNGFSMDSSFLERPWILVTSLFLHGSASHLLGNMFALALFGLILENTIGTRKFIAIYFLSGIAAGLAASIFYPSSIGASGAIFGAMGALAALRPRMMVWTYGVPMPMFVAAAFWLVLDIAGTFYPSNIANAAHIAGLAFGVGMGLWLKGKEPIRQMARKNRQISEEEFLRWEDDWMRS